MFWYISIGYYEKAIFYITWKGVILNKRETDAKKELRNPFFKNKNKTPKENTLSQWKKNKYMNRFRKKTNYRTKLPEMLE